MIPAPPPEVNMAVNQRDFQSMRLFSNTLDYPGNEKTPDQFPLVHPGDGTPLGVWGKRPLSRFLSFHRAAVE